MTYFDLKLDDIYKQVDQQYADVDWWIQDRDGLMRFEKQAEENQKKGVSRHFGKIGNSDPMNHVQ